MYEEGEGGRGRRVTVRARPSRGGRGIRGRRCVSTQGLVVERGVEDQSNASIMYC